ncbi:hypothetical protein BH18ACI4_BH18ACI4_28030 [soil metagenome]
MLFVRDALDSYLVGNTDPCSDSYHIGRDSGCSNPSKPVYFPMWYAHTRRLRMNFPLGEPTFIKQISTSEVTDAATKRS